MCRMIGFVAAEPMDVVPFLAGLSRFSRSGNLVDRWERRPGGNHPDGWGAAYRFEGDFRLRRSGKPANADPMLSEIEVATDRFIGHVRYASNTDTVNADNAHPFLLLGTALAHNGTFRGTIGEEARRRNISDTLVFLERLTALWAERSLSGLRDALGRILGDSYAVGEYSAANLLIASGESMFALRRYRRDGDYYTLYLKSAPGQAVVASEPLDEAPGWRLLDDGELVELRPQASRSTYLAAAV